MASKIGRKNNNWKNCPAKLVMKICLDYWYRLSIALGHLDTKAHKKFVWDRFWKVFPEAQKLFKYPLTLDSVYGRAFTPSAPTKLNENPNVNPTMICYVPAAMELIRRYDAGLPALLLTQLNEFCTKYTPVSEMPSSRDLRRTFSDQQVKEAMMRQKGKCLCGDPFSELRPPVGDHMVPWSDGGPTTSENCVALHVECHETKGTKSFVTWYPDMMSKQVAIALRGRTKLTI